MPELSKRGLEKAPEVLDNAVEATRIMLDLGMPASTAAALLMKEGLPTMDELGSGREGSYIHALQHLLSLAIVRLASQWSDLEVVQQLLLGVYELGHQEGFISDELLAEFKASIIK